MKTAPIRKSLACLLINLSGLALLSSQAQAQSAWVQPEGKTYLQLSYQNIGPYTKVFRDKGSDFRTAREITQTTLETYAEYGLTSDWTLIGSLPIHALEAGKRSSRSSISPSTIEASTDTKLGNLLLGARRQLSRGTYSWATQVALEIPTGDLDSDSGLSSGLDAFSLLPSLSVGRGFGQGYAQAYVGLGLRTNDHSHDWRSGLELGYGWEKFQLAYNIDLVSSFDNGDPDITFENAQTALFVDEQEYLALGLKASYEVSPGLRLHASMRSAASGNNVAKSSFVSVGLSYSW